MDGNRISLTLLLFASVIGILQAQASGRRNLPLGWERKISQDCQVYYVRNYPYPTVHRQDPRSKAAKADTTAISLLDECKKKCDEVNGDEGLVRAKFNTYLVSQTKGANALSPRELEAEWETVNSWRLQVGYCVWSLDDGYIVRTPADTEGLKLNGDKCVTEFKDQVCKRKCDEINSGAISNDDYTDLSCAYTSEKGYQVQWTDKANNNVDKQMNSCTELNDWILSFGSEENKVKVHSTEFDEIKSQVDGHSLTSSETKAFFSKINKKDDTTYRCTAAALKTAMRDLIEEDGSSVSVESYPENPVITSSPLTRNSFVGDSISFGCSYTGYPKPDITFYRNDTGEILDTPNHNTPSGPNGVFIATLEWKAKAEDFGVEFKCVVINKAGVEKRSFVLNEVSKPLPPTSITGEASLNKMGLTWTPSSTNLVDRYQIRVKMADKVIQTISIDDPKITSTIVSDLLPDTEYEFEMAAETIAGLGTWSSIKKSTLKPPEKQHVVMDNNTDKCSTGQIGTDADCKTAAIDLGYSYGFAGDWADHPSGCFLHDSQSMYFNSNAGKSNSKSSPVCKKV